ncbi:hypothetical protein [Streptomyces sp. NPDC001292]|uniref:hypothetical protein n=1 Tax=Streptomyces sp. NPDC001292 TaxID=3364558 RepID=UPI0036CE6605
MMIAGTYPLVQQLAVTEELPDEALPAVIEALCTTSRAFYGVDNRGEEGRKEAFAAALPAAADSRRSRPRSALEPVRPAVR